MRLLTVLSLAFLLAGCDLIAKLQNNIILVATLVESPAAPALPGVTGSAAVLANVYLGQKSGDLTTPPSQSSMSAINGATVTLTDTPPTGSPVVTTTLHELGTTGYYQPTSSPTYTAGHKYRFTATVGSETYYGEVVAPGAPTITLPSGDTGSTTGLYVYASYGARYSQFGLSGFPIGRGTHDVAFYGVWPVTASFNPDATPNCGNIPQTAGEILNLIFLDKSAYTVDPFTPAFATCFPNPPGAGTYVVGVTTLAEGATSGNLSIYSAALAGAGAAVGVIMGP